MKKAILCLMAMAAVLLSGCTFGDPAEKFMKTLVSNKMYMEIADGNGMEAISAVDFQDGKKNMYMNISSDIFSIVMMSNEDGAYIIDEASKTYQVSPETSESGASVIRAESYEKTGEGTGKTAGEECAYSQYDVVDSEGKSLVYKVYHKDGAVVAFEMIENGRNSMTLVKKYSAKIPAGMFEIPDGYTEAAD